MISMCRSETPSLSISAGTSTGRLPGRTKAITSVCVRACSTSGSTPIQSISSTAGPKRSTAWPPPPTRNSAVRSITVAETEPVQPIRQHRTRHTGAGDQDAGAVHRSPSSSCLRAVTVRIGQFSSRRSVVRQHLMDGSGPGCGVGQVAVAWTHRERVASASSSPLTSIPPPPPSSPISASPYPPPYPLSYNPQTANPHHASVLPAYHSPHSFLTQTSRLPPPGLPPFAPPPPPLPPLRRGARFPPIRPYPRSGHRRRRGDPSSNEDGDAGVRMAARALSSTRAVAVAGSPPGRCGHRSRRDSPIQAYCR